MIEDDQRLASMVATYLNQNGFDVQHSATAIRLLKAAMNADCDGQTGLQQLAGDATLLFYLTEEAQEGKQAFLEKRDPDFRKFPRFP